MLVWGLGATAIRGRAAFPACPWPQLQAAAIAHGPVAKAESGRYLAAERAGCLAWPLFVVIFGDVSLAPMSVDLPSHP